MIKSIDCFKQSLRESQSDAEGVLWYLLRSRRFEGFKFRRQHVLCGYIVDFVCLDKKLIVELDGGQHAEQVQYDAARTRRLESQGFQVLRFWNSEVFGNKDGVLETIRRALDPPHPPN